MRKARQEHLAAPPYNRLRHNDPSFDAIFDLVGDEPPASEYEALLTQDYLLECALETADPEIRNTALVALAGEVEYRHGATRPISSGPMFPHGPWIVTTDNDPAAIALYNRHYSAKKARKIGRFVGPGQRIVLITPEADALFAWRIAHHRLDGQWGAECTVFRNESQHLSSDLIAYAEQIAMLRWPTLVRFYTFVNPRKIRSTNPGYTFLQAGWTRTDYTSKGRKLILLEKIIVPDYVFDGLWIGEFDD
jgi:hypothetical protein